MRIVGSISHPKMTISIFAMNDKFQVKFEAGPMEQIYKFYNDEVSGVEAIKKIIDEEFMHDVMTKFVEMFDSLKAVKKRGDVSI